MGVFIIINSGFIIIKLLTGEGQKPVLSLILITKQVET